MNREVFAAAVGLKNTTTGDTLCDEKKQVILESMEFPEPVIQLAVEPKSKADQDKITLVKVKELGKAELVKVPIEECKNYLK